MDKDASQQTGDPVYQPLLTPSSIRLLHRDGEDEHGRLRFTMRTVDLRDDVLYHCLSYTWGNPHADGTIFRKHFEAQAAAYEAKSHTIILNGRPVQIHKNLYDGMKQLPNNVWSHRVLHKYAHLNGQTVVHMSAKINTPNGLWVLQSHLDHGADPSSLDCSGKSPAHYAAQYKNSGALEILLKAGADVTIKDNDGKMPIAYAWEQRDVESARLLVSAMVNRSITEAGADQQPRPVACFDHYVWIDALCINQEDVLERSHQVSIMDKIYERAGYVLVWLGEDDGWTATALCTMKKLIQADKRLQDGGVVPFVTCDERFYQQQALPPITRSEWDSLAALMARQWFKRMWVVQEAVLAKDLIMYCGSHEIVFGDIARVTDLLQRLYRKIGYESSLRYIPLEELACSLEYHFSMMVELRDVRHCLAEGWTIKDGSEAAKRRYDNERFSLGRLIPLTFPFHATNPLDKIYALLGLTQMCLNPKLQIYPDYRLSVEQCYMRTSSALIESTRSLAILSWVQSSTYSRIPELPSWVPDFSAKALNPLPPLKPQTLRPMPERSFWTDMTRLDHHVLGLEAVQCDTVKLVAGARLPKMELDPSWFTLLESLPITYHTGEPLGEVLWRTLCANTDTRGATPAPFALGEHFKNLLCALLCEDAEKALSSTLTTFAAMSQVLYMDESTSSKRTDTHAELIGRQERELRNGADFSVGSEHFKRARELLKPMARLIVPTWSNALAFTAYDNCIPTLLDLDHYFRNSSTMAVPAASISRGFDQRGKQITTIHLGKSSRDDPNFRSAAAHKESRNAFAFAHDRHYSGRKLFVTEGGYLGLGSTDVMEGDRIFFLNGATGPFILRPVNLMDEDQGQSCPYKLVSESYIHGIEHMLQKLSNTAALRFERIELI